MIVMKSGKNDLGSHDSVNRMIYVSIYTCKNGTSQVNDILPPFGFISPHRILSQSTIDLISKT